MPLLDLELARRITEGIVALLARYAPDARPWPEDRSAAEFAGKLRRRETREIVYLPDRLDGWPTFFTEDDPPRNLEQVFLRVGRAERTVRYACAVFTGSLVHWVAASADVHGTVSYAEMDP